MTNAATPCVGGTAAGYACSNVDLIAFLPLSTFGSGAANDIWGWTDPQTGTEYALIGLDDGTGFVDLSDPANPVYLGKLPTHTSTSSWRDVKVFADHAFIVSEASGHGMQVFDLTALRTVNNPPVTFSETAHYGDFGSAHNIVVNEDTGFAYAVGAGTCAGGLHMVDVQAPLSPTSAGCFSGDGYTHDAQCVVYNGPDAAHQGKEVCFNSNEDTVTIVDVSAKNAPVQLSRTGYPTSSYIHQGWLTQDHRYFYQNDELDTGNTRTMIWDVTDLDNPILGTVFANATTSRDHNLYIVGDRMYQANYTTGLRILDIDDRLNPVEIGFFDTYSPSNGLAFNGAWSNYPFFASGIVVVSSIGEGLFVLRPEAGNIVGISGQAMFFDGTTGVEGVSVDLSGDASGSVVTTSNGGYNVSVGRGGTYTVTPRRDADPAPDRGVTTLDIAFARLHILGSSPLASPYQIIAADVDRDALVSTIDIAFIRLLILGSNNTFPGGLWRFVDSDYAFPDPDNPFLEAFPEARTFSSIDGSTTGQDFVTVKMGDVDGDWATSASGSAKQTAGVVRLEVGSASPAASEEVLVPVRVVSGFENVGGLQFTLAWDPAVLAYDGLANYGLPGLAAQHVGAARAGDGFLTLAWDDATLAGQTLGAGTDLLTVRFRASGSGETPVAITSGVTSAFAHRAGDLAALVVEGSAGIVAAVDAPAVPVRFELAPNYPNPFNPVTTIAYALPEAGAVRLAVYNAMGQHVRTLIDRRQEAGQHRVTFDAAGLPSGVYYYRLAAAGAVRQQRMVLLK